jgi:CxxC-x17-CxxC domain-containing protein
MKNYQKGGSSGFRGDKGTRSSFKPSFKNRNEDRGSTRDMPSHKAICSECNKGCDVPFKPSNDKPVYCRDCFSAKRDKETKEYRASSSFETSKKFSHERLDASPKVIRQEYSHAQTSAPSSDETKKQLADISSKLDKLMSAFEKMADTKSHVVAPLLKTVQSVSSIVKVAPSAKKVAVKKTEVKKVAVSVPVKKVEVKKTVVKASAKKEISTKKTIAKKVPVKKTK